MGGAKLLASPYRSTPSYAYDTSGVVAVCLSYARYGRILYGDRSADRRVRSQLDRLAYAGADDDLDGEHGVDDDLDGEHGVDGHRNALRFGAC